MQPSNHVIYKTFQNTEEFSKLRPTRLTRCHSSLVTSRNPPRREAEREAWGLFPGQPLDQVET